MSIEQSAELVAQLPHGVSICYRRYGSASQPCVVLIAGLGLQLHYWPASLIAALTGAGFSVLCFDNRDAGRSSRIEQAPPSRLRQLFNRVNSGYVLADMCADVAHLLDHLQIPQAHVLGMSMGGMIGQELSYLYPAKVASLISIFSTTGNRRVGQPAFSTLCRMAFNVGSDSEADAVARYVALMKHIGNPSVAGIERDWAGYAALAWQRNGHSPDRKGFARQIGAILRSGDRSAHLQQIRVPTLVIHGDRDPMVATSGGVATAKAIAGAELQIVPGMRHQIDGPLASALAPMLLGHIRRQQELAA